MTSRVAFTASARADLKAIADFIARENPQRSRSFVAELRSRLESRLSTFGSSGPTIGKYRYLVIGRYVAVYELTDEAASIRIVLITEGHRDWRRIVEDFS